MPKSQGGKQKKIKGDSIIGGATDGSDQDQGGPVFNNADNEIAIRVWAKPGAKYNSITSVSTEGVGIQISAAPVDGEANLELIKFVAKLLGIRKSEITLDKGPKARSKVLVLHKDCPLSLQAVIDKLKSEADS